MTILACPRVVRHRPPRPEAVRFFASLAMTTLASRLVPGAVVGRRRELLSIAQSEMGRGPYGPVKMRPRCRATRQYVAACLYKVALEGH